MSKPALVFDLDGTLVDTAPDLWAATNHVLTAEGRRPVELAEVRAMVGHGARRLIERGFAATGDAVEPHRLDSLFADFLAYYGDHIAEASQVYPGVRQLIDQARQAGFALSVCTNKLEALSVKLLAALDLLDSFAAVIGPDTIAVAKPDPAPLRAAVERSGGDMARAVLIGDSETDIATGRAAGVPTIAVSFGYTATPVAEFAPDFIVDHHDEIWPLVTRLNG